jgi:hypothetical protein
MRNYVLPNPARCREIPKQFSWVDHRLVRDGYFEKCHCEALALYLFLLTVADDKGVSYYGQARLMKQLKLDSYRLTAARDELIAHGLVAYQQPIYQVLSLCSGFTAPEMKPVKNPQSHQGQSVKAWLEQLHSVIGGEHD